MTDVLKQVSIVIITVIYSDKFRTYKLVWWRLWTAHLWFGSMRRTRWSGCSSSYVVTASPCVQSRNRIHYSYVRGWARGGSVMTLPCRWGTLISWSLLSWVLTLQYSLTLWLCSWTHPRMDRTCRSVVTNDNWKPQKYEIEIVVYQIIIYHSIGMLTSNRHEQTLQCNCVYYKKRPSR